MLGPNILNDKTILAQLDLVVSQFVEWRLMNKKFPWTNRKPALLFECDGAAIMRDAGRAGPREGGLGACWKSGLWAAILGLGGGQRRLWGFEDHAGVEVLIRAELVAVGLHDRIGLRVVAGVLMPESVSPVCTM